MRFALFRHIYLVSIHATHNLLQEFVIASADSLEDILRDWSRVVSVLVPTLEKDESKIHQLPKLVDELMKAKRMSQLCLWAALVQLRCCQG